MQSRHEVNEAFRVSGKVAQRKVDVGQKVREGDVLAVLDDTDYRLAEDAARQQLAAATAQARQAESDRHRLDALKSDGSVSPSDDEKAQTGARTSSAAAEAEARKLELARNRLKYTVLRASQTGVVTAVRSEVGQVVAEGQPIVSIANEGEPEIVADVPEDHLTAFQGSRYKAWLASAPQQTFEVVLRELSPQAAAQTRTFRAEARGPRVPLGATATSSSASGQRNPSSSNPCLGHHAEWGPACGLGDSSHGSNRPERLISSTSRCTDIVTTRCSCPGPPAGDLVVIAGVQRWRRA